MPSSYDLASPTMPPTAESYERWIASRPLNARGNPGAGPEVDWANKPSQFCIVRGGSKIPLPQLSGLDQLQLGVRREPARAGDIRLEDLSDLLLLSAGILRRKLSIAWTRRLKRANFEIEGSRFSRGVASGGGLYPHCVYVVTLTPRPLRPGVYHYDVAHHALDLVRFGDYRKLIANALNDTALDRFDLLFVLTGRFWQSAFKYGSFAYKVMMQDVGALLGGMEQIAYSLSWNTAVLHWFDDRRIGNLLGLDTEHEAPFVVLGASAANRVAAREEVETRAHSEAPQDALPAADFVHLERSKGAQPLRHLLKIHASTCVGESWAPLSLGQTYPATVCQGAASAISRTNLAAALLNRETSWGQIIDRQPALEAGQLSAALSFAMGGGLSLLRLEAVIGRVDGLSRGLWHYDEATGQLVPKGAAAPAQVFRRIYTARFHNLDLVPAVLVLIGKLADAVARFGQRGIRIMNCEAGMFAQRVYLACAATSLGCGAVLGFNRTNLSEALRLDSATEVPLLMVFIGPRRPRAYAFDFRLV